MRQAENKNYWIAQNAQKKERDTIDYLVDLHGPVGSPLDGKRKNGLYPFPVEDKWRVDSEGRTEALRMVELMTQRWLLENERAHRSV